MRKLVGAGSFILVVKTLKGINLITDTPVKIFIGFIKCVGMSLRLCLTLSIAIFQRFLRNKTLNLPQKSQKA